MRTNKFSAITAAFIALSFQSGEAAAQCLDYEPEVVTLRGSLVRETHPGRPNYESIQNGDEAEVIWVLHLADEVCVNAADELNAEAHQVTRVQLVLKAEQYEKYRDLLGHQVEVVGQLFQAHTGHHHTTLLLTTREMRGESSL